MFCLRIVRSGRIIGVQQSPSNSEFRIVTLQLTADVAAFAVSGIGTGGVAAGAEPLVLPPLKVGGCR